MPWDAPAAISVHASSRQAVGGVVVSGRCRLPVVLSRAEGTGRLVQIPQGKANVRGTVVSVHDTRIKHGRVIVVLSVGAEEPRIRVRARHLVGQFTLQVRQSGKHAPPTLPLSLSQDGPNGSSADSMDFSRELNRCTIAPCLREVLPRVGGFAER